MKIFRWVWSFGLDGLTELSGTLFVPLSKVQALHYLHRLIIIPVTSHVLSSLHCFARFFVSLQNNSGYEQVWKNRRRGKSKFYPSSFPWMRNILFGILGKRKSN
ncbi:hypothetical protein Dsin_026491 [Dipteronia sinensis]|uniref:Uncharacterized protein n=1 Tax=Dipteronia sinensis TaxID=43782 RepID=A0AAE0DY57_9ROSI|nr:hypothetical protein Dsin_026491 [Dipteronia sinensis]